ncbi:dATP/dGTP diphosphohydrolase domain-containing protein [Burkholderia anthina]|uniref:dATP/dGTP diphosphohydrolase domain-containing protein n=1 Tax=Burkholderia anthina TaxID=179879 RepID=UPI00158E1095|nr:dATP/dGTP diphosphohydrolase domain-containing protein [Burkholderia anthina]
MSDVSKYVAEWTKVGKRVIVLPTGEEGEITGFYGMQYRLVRIGVIRTPRVVDLTDIGPADQQHVSVSRDAAVSRETESHVQRDSVPVETLRRCTDIPEEKFRDHWLEQTGNHRDAAPITKPCNPLTPVKSHGPYPGETQEQYRNRTLYETGMLSLDEYSSLVDSNGGTNGAGARPAHSKPTNPKDAIATDKLPLHLLSPFVKAYQAIAHYLGNVKYGAWNWRAAGIRLSVYKAAHDRHMDAFWEGEFYDPIDGTPHLANAQCCLNIVIDAWCTGNVIDDRPPSNPERLAEVRAELEALMPKIRAKYADKHPRHFTIADTDELHRPRVAQPQGDVR